MPSIYFICLPPNFALHTKANAMKGRSSALSDKSYCFTYMSQVRCSAYLYPSKNQLNRRPSMSAEWFLQGKELSLCAQLWATSQSWRKPWVFACLQPLLAEADGKVGTTVSLMLVLCICLVPWTLHLSPLALPKHHLLAMSLLRSGGSRTGSSSGKAGRGR